MYDDDMYGYPIRRDPMPAAALIFGILSIFTCAIFYLSLPFAALAILFALLSRTERKISGKSRVGIICGIIGLILTIILTVSAFYYVLATPAGRTQLEQYLRIYTGDDEIEVEDLLDELFNETQEEGVFL